MTAPVLYASANQLMDRLNVPENDSREGALLEILDGASRWVERETGHFFYPTASQTRYFTAQWNDSRFMSTESGAPFWASQRRGVGLEEVQIDEFLSVTALATDQDGDGVYETVWTVTQDYWLGPRNAAQKGRPYTTIHRNPVRGRYLFPFFENGISVTGTFNYSATTPSDIKELTLAVAELMARPVLDLTIAGVQSYKLGTDLQVTMKSEDLSPAAQGILDSYRTESLVFA